MRSQKHVKRQRRNKWIKRTLFSIMILVFFIFGTGVGYYGSEIMRVLSDVSENTPEELQDTSEQDALLEELNPFSVLLLGLDDADGTRRSDTLIVATINPNDNSVKLVSIPRDTMITLPDSDRSEKINALYTIYGISGTIDFVEEYLDIPISYYATLNFEGLVDLVDAVGGITVDSPLDFTVQDSEENSNAIEIEEGLQSVDGEHALGYARMRKQDPRGDWGRQERQREVIQTLAEELMSLDSFINFAPIMDAVRENLQTNLSGQQIWTIANNYSEAANDIESLEIQGEADYVYFPSYDLDLYVWLPFDESIEDIQSTLRNHLELDPDSDNINDGEVGIDEELEQIPSEPDDSFSNPLEDEQDSETE
ncbi:LCP family protein [Marinilactibacillus psychrotolerans]|uniref:LytR family transcriptional regulator n=1 Tax=Marinilactibacillus psychrotolerans TaxID=191770 RepID=A0AAV3WSI5_9LACT|nr:LCP family protein [Marinilactibacillus psychrotolerans]GEL67686.1 LytR family transcriptional regulator [Marinilactibacillus psychrotolerans]GEQ36457.1 LytR family transcriptional regulator [Marinilactibacillus psychrotolerans]SDD03628.1 transcriptional attenuator, LytR family [Marinilactibacillus psychrotolerans]